MEAVTVGAGRVLREQTLKRDFGSCLTTIKMLGKTSPFTIEGKQSLVKYSSGTIIKTFNSGTTKDTLYSHFKKIFIEGNTLVDAISQVS